MKKTTKRPKVNVQRAPQTNLKLVKEVVKAQLKTVTGGMMAGGHCKSR